MPDSNPQSSTATDSDPAAGQPATTDPAPASGETPLESLPESWQREIKRLRSEGQSKGARISALEGELQTARSDFATREATLTQSVSDGALTHARYRAAIAAGIPSDQADDFASRLRGATAEEIAQDAQSLAGLVQASAPVSPDTSRRGLDPSQGAGNGTPAAVTPAQALTSQLRQALGR